MSGFGASDIQALINAGAGFAADALGASTTVYRPSSASAPIAPASIVTTILASFNTSPTFDSVKPSDYPNPKFYGLFDRTPTLPGDYLVTGAATYFIASQDLNQSTLCVECNRTVTFVRPNADSSGVGKLPPGGQTPNTDVALMTAWPASVLIKTRGETGQALLPGDTKLALFETLLPALLGVTLRTSDLMTDDQGRRFTVSAAELSALGWRLYCQLSVT